MAATGVGGWRCRDAVLVAVGVLAGLALAHWRPESGAEAGGKAASGAEDRLRELKLKLPPFTPSKNTLVQSVRVGNLLFVSGHGPAPRADGKPVVGRLGT